MHHTTPDIIYILFLKPLIMVPPVGLAQVAVFMVFYCFLCLVGGTVGAAPSDGVLFRQETQCHRIATFLGPHQGT